LQCKTTERPHKARGLCSLCYEREARKERKIRTSATVRRKRPTREYLHQQYVVLKKSLQEIADDIGYSRVQIYNLLGEYGIKVRSKSEARQIALEHGKIAVERDNGDETSRTVTLALPMLDEEFFDEWSPKMAYVLGMIYTDGSLQPGKTRESDGGGAKTCGRITLTQKDPAFLRQILAIMGTHVAVLRREERMYGATKAGETYYFHINSDRIYARLLRFGLHPNKSRSLQFPDVPKRCLRHFIRGCWDGDGSFYVEKRSNTIHADFVSGSRSFLVDMVAILSEEGFSHRKIYKKRGRNPSYHFKYHGKECIDFFHYLYDGVPRRMFWEQKYRVVRGYLSGKAKKKKDEADASR